MKGGAWCCHSSLRDGCICAVRASPNRQKPIMQAPSMFYRIWTAGVYLGIPQRKPRTHCGGSRKRRRRTSMKLVDADKARECFGGDGVTGAVMQRMFDSLPTIDAVPVVRCRDCKWFNHYTMECESDDVATDHEGGASFSINFGPDDFCSYGQRKEADHG
nr:MAG TPA: hypothetical protein [Caudoviricetes sp.]